jgi:hypothetical protein
MTDELTPGTPSPFEQIRRTNEAGNEYWSSRDFARVLGYSDYRNFEAVVEKARTACFNSGQRVNDHFVEITDMIEVGKGALRPAKTVLMSRYACWRFRTRTRQRRSSPSVRPISPSKPAGRSCPIKRSRIRAVCCSARKGK